MAITVHVDGTQTAVIGTEHVLNTTTPDPTVGIFQFMVDCDAMVIGDAVEFRVKEKVLAAGTQRTVVGGTFANDPSADDPIWVSPSLILIHGWDFTLRQTAGTGRAFPFSIRRVA